MCQQGNAIQANSNVDTVAWYQFGNWAVEGIGGKTQTQPRLQEGKTFISQKLNQRCFHGVNGFQILMGTREETATNRDAI